MHDEPCPYYTFTGDKVLGEVSAYRLLRRIGINLPVLYAFDVREQYLLKEYIPGPTTAEQIAAGELQEDLVRQLFRMAQIACSNGLNLDYFPTNFVGKEGRLYYIDYETDEYHPDWNLQNWGLYYWANSRGMRQLLEKNDDSFLTNDPESGVPIKEPFNDMVGEWIMKYDNERRENP